MAMRVPELQQQFRYESPNVPAARLQGMQVQTNAAMFGGESGRQMEKAGYLVQRGGEQMAHLVDDYNNTKAREGASQFQQDFLAWQTEAAKKVGKDGISTGQDYDTWAQQRMGELTKGMGTVQRGRFESIVGERMALQKRWAEGYGQEQDVVHKTSLFKSEMSGAGNLIATNPGDPGMVAQGMRQIEDAAYSLAKLKGLDPKAGATLMQESVDEHLGGTIHNLIQQGKTGAASNLMQQHGGQLGGMTVGKLNAAMTREREHQEAKARARAAESRQVAKEAAVNGGYRALYAMNPEEAQAAVMNPEWQQSMGLTADMAKDAGALLHTMRSWEVQAQKQNREKYEADLYTKTVNMAMGEGGQEKDPVKAMETIQKDSTIDGKTKMEMLNAVQNNLLNARDDAFFVSDLTQRIIDAEGAVPDSEIWRGVATGKLRQATATSLIELREMTQGGHGSMVKNAFSALNEMFRKSTMADGTPEHAASHLAAQRQLQADIDAARQSGNRKELERVTSPEYIMTMGRRFTLSMKDQQRAVINKIGTGANSSVPASGMKVRPARSPGESIDAYRKRVGTE